MFLASFFPENAGFHWRVTKWAEELRQKGFSVDIKHVFNKDEFECLRRQGSVIRFQTRSLWKKLRHVLTSQQYDLVVVRRTLLLYNEYGNLFYEKLLLKIHPSAILDFDDDMLIREEKPRKKTLYGTLLGENHNKFYASLKLYRKFIVGSNYLQKIPLKVNPSISESDIAVVPTCVGYGGYAPKDYSEHAGKITFGWIGGNGNQYYLDRLIEPLNKIYSRTRIELLIISGKPYVAEEAEFPIRFLEWSLSTEVEHLKQIDIGLMPLDDNPRTRGKCGFKLIQYGGMGIVSIASAVGANNEIIQEGQTGWLVSDESQWYDVLLKAIQSENEFPEIGKQARNRVMEHYSFEGNRTKFISFINSTFSS